MIETRRRAVDPQVGIGSGMDRSGDDSSGSRERRIRRSGLHVLRTGTYLHTYCPHCQASLIQGDWIVFNVAAEGRDGELKLSPRFNVFDKESTIELPSDTELDDICCPRCRASLINPRITCGRCGAKAARIRISAVHLDIHLNVCARLGCPWHGLSERDKARLILED